MKAISLHQPWASLMQVGAKSIETRNRLTHIRGDVAICATKKFIGGHSLDAGLAMMQALKGFVPKGDAGAVNMSDLPYGVVVCVVEIFDCIPTDKWTAGYMSIVRERHFGDYSPGRFAWLTRNLRRLKNPVPVIGRQGFFNLPSDVEAKVRNQI